MAQGAASRTNPPSQEGLVGSSASRAGSLSPVGDDFVPVVGGSGVESGSLVLRPAPTAVMSAS